MSLLDIGIPRAQWLLGIRVRFPKFFEHSSRDDQHLSNLACSRVGIKSNGGGSAGNSSPEHRSKTH